MPDAQDPADGRHCGPSSESSAPRPGRQAETPTSAYRDWRQRHALQEIDAELMAERMLRVWRKRPRFHLLIHLQPGEEALLADTLDSLSIQLYGEWRLTVVAGFAAPLPAFDQLPMLKWVQTRPGDNAAAVMNRAARGEAADWLSILPAGVRLEPHFLMTCADYINLRPHWRLIYTDDDTLQADGGYGDPRFKPDLNPDLLRSMDYLGLFLIEAEAFVTAGGHSPLAGAEGYDLALRVFERCGEGAMGHVSDVLCHLPARTRTAGAPEAEREALRRHLARTGRDAEVGPGYRPYLHRVVYRHADTPLVSILVPTKDREELIRPCIDSLLEKTTYPNFEVIIVDNQSSAPAVLQYYEELASRDPRVRLLHYPRPFNFSAICNLGADAARGDYLLLLNNDTRIVQGEWLERMMSHAQRPEVGAVGARLVYPQTGRVQHAGVVLGLNHVADHPFCGIAGLDEGGYMDRALADQNYSAVTAACMLMRTSVYEAVGGMDETRLRVSYNDVDLCLRIIKEGYKITYTPYAVVVHHGSSSIAAVTDPVVAAASQARDAEERAAMLERWLPMLACDPAYNRHLSLCAFDMRPESTAVVAWDVNFHDRPRILGLPLAGGAGHYRVAAPLQALSSAGHVQSTFVQPRYYFDARVFTAVEVARAAPDVMVHHAPVHEPQLQALEAFRRFNGVFQVYTLDDLITAVPEKSPVRKHFYEDMAARLRRGLAACDRLIVTTPPLRDLTAGMIDDIRLVPNFLEGRRWLGLSSQRRRGPRPRVGWAGAQQHHGDLAVLGDVVRATADEVDWVFFGMCPEDLRPYVREVHDFVIAFRDYPARLASLDLDLAVAPLESNPFNEAKSNLRLLEYGILGWPVVCSDILPYRDAPVARVPNTPAAWIQAIRERVHDLDAAAREGDGLRAWVRGRYILEEHLDQWLEALLPPAVHAQAPAARRLHATGL